MHSPIEASKNNSTFYTVLLVIFFLAVVCMLIFERGFIKAKAVVILDHFDLSKVLISPVSNSSKLAIASNIWLPKPGVLGVESVDITAKAAFFIEPETGKVIYEKDSKERLPIASLAKIMTAIVALEHKNLADPFIVSDYAAGVDPDKMFLKSGETLTLGELLDGVFLVSANDAAETIAEGTTGNRDEFIKLMNLKAQQIGMDDTLFINPTGLEEDSGLDDGLSKPQYSTAYDVALMSRYAITHWPNLTGITSQPEITIPFTQTHQDYTLENGINLITTYPGVIGFKIGYTPDAGLTIVTLAKKDGKEVLGVLLDCTNRRDDTKAMLDYSFAKLGV